MEELIAVLKKSRLLCEMPGEIVRYNIGAQGSVREYEKGEYIFRAQEKVDVIRIIISGRVNTLHIFSDGNSSVTASMGESDELGLDLICTRTKISPYYAVAIEKTKIFTFSSDIVLKQGFLPEKERMLLQNQLLMMISHQNIQKEYRMAILSQNGLRNRIIIYLSMQANQKNTNTFTSSFSREEMASFLCVNRSALSHELSLMQQEGIIKFRKNKFTLLNWYRHDGVF